MINLTDDTTIHVFEGVKLMDIYDKETGFPRLDEELRKYEVREWARNRNREIENEVSDLRGRLSDGNHTHHNAEIHRRISELLQERDDNTYRFGLAGKEFERLYLEKKDGADRDGDFEFSDEELEDPQLLARDEEKKNTEEKLMNTLDRINNNYDIQKWIDEHTWNNHYVGRPFIYVDDIQEVLMSKQGVESDVFKGSEDSLYDKLISSGIPMSVIEEEPKDYSHKPNDNDSRFRFITEEMFDLYSKKNTDYGDAFIQSLDEDGLLVSKIRLKDKLNRFAKLIENDALVNDESMRDTLIDMANYAVMTMMWLDANE